MIVTSTQVTSYKLIVFFVFCILFLISFSTVFAIEATGSADENAKKYEVIFPIEELGGCESISDCRQFCGLDENQQSCIEYAKKKGFYSQDRKLKNAVLIAAAKAALGCSSEESCKEVCEDQENKDKCRSFAQKFNLSPKKPQVNNLLEKAKLEFGCTSEETCKQFCQSEENREKCSNLAKSLGVRGGFKKDYERFCKENPERCKPKQAGALSTICIRYPQKCGKPLEGGTSSPESSTCRNYLEKCKSATASAEIADYCQELKSICEKVDTAPPLLERPITTSTESGVVKGVQTVKGIFSRALDLLSSLFL